MVGIPLDGYFTIYFKCLSIRIEVTSNLLHLVQWVRSLGGACCKSRVFFLLTYYSCFFYAGIGCLTPFLDTPSFHYQARQDLYISWSNPHKCVGSLPLYILGPKKNPAFVKAP